MDSRKGKQQVDIITIELKNSGYNIYYKVLNALDYNIPQYRQRIYATSIREDVDNNLKYKVNYTDNKYYKNNPYPEPLEFTRPLYTLLEQEVDKKYFLSDKTLDGFIEHRKRNERNGNGFGFKGTIDINGYTHTILPLFEL